MDNLFFESLVVFFFFIIDFYKSIYVFVLRMGILCGNLFVRNYEYCVCRVIFMVFLLKEVCGKIEGDFVVVDDIY